MLLSPTIGLRTSLPFFFVEEVVQFANCEKPKVNLPLFDKQSKTTSASAQDDNPSESRARLTEKRLFFSSFL
ncbi:hypothetical protein CEXT_609491 [Caerostris extrusa]|uniref:Uncharacterized protein n=1 Tax=Caerostris extrusa TaxID=172846 RepID=A0AAV4PGV1_CAEEX|nr:hypothetical protein CEXT_609491 [Caerostris extrusa]